MITKIFRWAVRLALVLGVVAVIAAAFFYWRGRQLRVDLFTAFTPVEITNCQLQRFGNPGADGGYAACANLLPEAKSAYSYGISGRDEWGCEVSATVGVPVHQYDCFDLTVPACGEKASPMFHAECIGPDTTQVEGRPFDTLANQIQKNGDAGKRLVVKMDIEGWEWETLLQAPDATLQSIDQLVVEFHGIETEVSVRAAERLAQFFYVANVHQNNIVCLPGFDPFPGPVFEALFVNKRIAVTSGQPLAARSSTVDRPNNPNGPDCQALPDRSEPQRIGQWLRRVGGVVGYRLFGIPFA